MEIRIKFKPQVHRATTREEVFRSVTRGRVFTVDRDGVYYAPIRESNATTVRVYNLQKINRKARGTKGPNREVVREAHWIGYVYDIPVRVLQVSGLRVKQGARTFKFETRSH